MKPRSYVLVLLATLLILSGISLPALASEPRQDWSRLTTDISANHVMTAIDGGARVSCGDEGITAVSADGQVTGVTLGPPALLTPQACVGQSVVGRDGTTYTYATALGDAFVAAYQPNGSLRWSYQAPCAINAVAIGDNHVVYAVASGAGTTGACPSAHLLGLATQTGQLVMDTDLGDASVPYGGLAAYNAGLVVWSTDSLRFISYDGSDVKTVNGNFAPVDGGYTTSATVTGTAFAAERADAATRAFCGNDSVVGSIGLYRSTGRAGRFPLTDCARVDRLWATPQGGVAFGLRTVSSTGISSNQLVVLDGNGTVAFQRSLPATDPSDNLVVYTGYTYAVDTHGITMLQRNYVRYSNTSGDRWPGVRLEAISRTGASLGVYEFAGDPGDSSDASHGYLGKNAPPALGTNRAFVLTTRCNIWGQCSGAETLHAVTVPGLGLDYPRGTLLGVGGPVPAPQPAVRSYVALGDSFSSGEGVTPFEAGTDVPKSQGAALYNLCHRSSRAYPRLLEKDAALRLKMEDDFFSACSGATTERLTSTWPLEKDDPRFDDRNNNEGSQINPLDANTQLVTMTMGGNDAKFSDLVGRCVLTDCSAAHTRRDFLGSEGLVTKLDGALKGAYNTVLNTAPNATVYIGGYPQLLPNSGCSRPGTVAMEVATRALVTLLGGYNGPLQVAAPKVRQKLAEMGMNLTLPETVQLIRSPNISFNGTERTFARDVVNNLNTKIRTVIRQVNAERGGKARLVYVDPASAFAGHELCMPQPYFHGLVVNPANLTHDLSYSFHPNALGQQAYARAYRPKLVPAS